VSIMSVLQNLFAVLLFMVLGMHHIFIRAIVESYAVVPVGAWHMSGGLLQFVIAATTGVFILAIKLAAPVMASLLAATVESSEDAIIAEDLNGIVVSWNPGAERLLGYRADEMIGSSIERIGVMTG